MLDQNSTIQHRFVCMLLAVFLIGCTAQPDATSTPDTTHVDKTSQPAFKGMELYSWRTDTGEWRYSILLGTNRLKSVAEVQEDPLTLAQLKTAISSLAQGESLFWLNRVDESTKEQGFELAFPPRQVIAELQHYAAAHQITLHTPQD